MPILPTIKEQPAQVGVPRFPAGSGLSEFGKAFGALADIAEASQKQQEALDFATLSAEHDIGADEDMDAVKDEPDYLKRPELFQKKLQERQAAVLAKTSSSDVQRALRVHFARTTAQKTIQVRAESLKEWNSKRLADLDTSAETLSTLIISSNDPTEVDRLKRTYEGLVYGLSSGQYAALNPQQAEKSIRDFDNKLDQKRARRMIGENAASFLSAADRGEFKNLTEDQVVKLREDARKTIERDEARQDKVFRDVKKIAMDRVQAAANQGLLKDSDLKDMLEGKHPYITAAEAREIKNINDNPPTGEGAQQIRVIMEQYKSGPSSFARITETRRELNNLRRNMKAGNPLMMKALDELQTDERTMQGIDAAKINREIKAAEDAYDAQAPVLPFNMPMITNQKKQDKAKIAETIRKGGDPTKLLQQKNTELKNRKDNIEQKHGDALNW